jgi:hypothetical protein
MNLLSSILVSVLCGIIANLATPFVASYVSRFKNSIIRSLVAAKACQVGVFARSLESCACIKSRVIGHLPLSLPVCGFISGLLVPLDYPGEGFDYANALMLACLGGVYGIIWYFLRKNWIAACTSVTAILAFFATQVTLAEVAQYPFLSFWFLFGGGAAGTLLVSQGKIAAS